MNEQYTLIDKEKTVMLAKIGINYTDSDCPICWHPFGWDWDEPAYLLMPVPERQSPREYLKENLDSLLAKVSECWPDHQDCNFMLVRGQFFVNETADSTKKFVVFQPTNKIPEDAIIPKAP